MNFKEIVESELTLIREISGKNSQLTKLVERNILNFSLESLLQQLLPLITQSKNIKLTLSGITLIQKFQNYQQLKIEHFDIIIDYLQNSKQLEDEAINIKLVSTLLHIITPNNINFNNYEQLTKLINFLISFSCSENPIIVQSSIQGIITLINELEDLLLNKQEQQLYSVLFQLLELFFKILQNKEQNEINIIGNSFLSKDIFILLLKCGKCAQTKDKFIQFYNETIYQFLLHYEFTNEINLLEKINIIRLIFTYILIMEDKFELIQQIMIYYSQISLFDSCKIAIHDGILCLYSNSQIFMELLQKQPQGNYNDYNELILKQIFQYSLNEIKEFSNYQQSPKQNILINRFTFQYVDMNISTVPNIFIQQIKTLIQIITESIQRIQSDDQKDTLYQEIKYKMTQSQLITNEHQEELQQQDQFQETENDDLKFKTIFDKLWRPILKIIKQILKIANNQQYPGILDYVAQLVKICQQQNQISSFQLLIRFFASQAAPQSLKYNENDKWIIACKHFQDILLNSINLLTAKTWNLVFQTFQRIEQVVTKSTEVKITSDIFMNSGEYTDMTIYQMIDGLSQLALQVSERLQTSQKKMFDSIYKSFAIDKLIIMVNCNWNRIEKIWIVVEALCLCLCGSKIIEMRLNAIHTYKDIILSGVDYFKNHTSQWGNDWAIHLLNPLSELIISPYDDVVENVMQLFFSLLKDQSKYIPLETYKIIIKLLELTINDLFIKVEMCLNKSETNQIQAKSLFTRIVISINCMSELVFNQIDKLDNQLVMILAKIASQLNLQEPFNYEITNKVICMTWQIQERMLKLDLHDQQLWNTTIKLFKSCLDNSDDLKFAGIHIAAQICVVAKNEQFDEIFQLFEEQISHSMEYYLKIEHHQLSLIQQTPRFTQIPMETPKFQGTIKQALFDKTISIQLFKQQFELVKVCIQKITDVIIAKKIYSKFYYYLQLFNQAQCVFVKHEIVLQCTRILEQSENEQQLIISTAEFVSTLINYEQSLDIEDIQYYLENHTFQEMSIIISKMIEIKPKKGFQILALLFHFICQDSILALLSEDTNIFKFYFKQCFNTKTFSQDLYSEWLNYILQQIQSLGIVHKHHEYIEFLSNVMENILNNYKLKENEIEMSKQFIFCLNSLLNKCQRCMNDTSERLQFILIQKMKSLIAALIPYLDQNSIEQLFEPLITTQLMIPNKRTQDLITFFANDAKYLNEQQQNVVVKLFTDYYINKLSSNDDIDIQSNLIINLIGFIQTENPITQKFVQFIKIPFLKAIHNNLKDYLNDDGTNYEKQFNITLMLNYLGNLEKEEIQEFYITFVELIKCESIEIRTKLINLLSKFF